MRQDLDWITTPESSSIAAFAYEAADLMLYVRFKNGRAYRYSSVPSSVYEAFTDADSKGAFFNAEVQGSYSYTQI